MNIYPKEQMIVCLKKQISLSTEIYASPKEIWRILINFKNYPYWNPFIQNIDGDLAEGSESNALLRLSEKQYYAEIGILNVVHTSELRCYIRKFGSFPDLLKDELKLSIMQITETNESSDSNLISRFDLQGSFRGLLVLFRVNEFALRRAFEKMACALKTVTENTNLNPCMYQY